MGMAELMKEINKEWKGDILHRGVATYDYKRIPFTSPRLNYMSFGGIPMGKLVEFYGEEHGGKALGLDCDILTPNGYKKMRDIHIGDAVISGQGQATTVVGVYPQGVKPMYRFTFADHTTIDCSDEHLWAVNYHGAHGIRQEVLSANELYKCYKSKKNGRNYFKYSIPTPIVSDIDNGQKLLIDPYLLGVLLGDGGLNGRCVNVCLSEPDLVEKVSNIVNDDWDMKLTSTDGLNYRIVHRGKITNQYSRNMTLRQALNNLGLHCKPIDKHIPKEYLYTSVENRILLLQGLYDTDGYTDKSGALNFDTSSPQLSNDFAFLVRSLGGIDMVTSSLGRYKKDDSWIECNTTYHHRLIFRNGIMPCTSKKHLLRYNSDRVGMYYRKIVDITPIAPVECQCIKVDADCHTFIAENVTVTHNTTTALDIVANYQHMENAKGVVYADLENTLDTVWATKLGVDFDRDDIWILNPTNQGAETIFEKLLQMIETDEIGLIVIDSLGVMVSNQALDKSVEEKTYGGIAMALTNFSKKAEMLCHKHNCTIIGINQMRDDMNSMYGGQTTTGGKAWKHNCFSGNTRFVTDKGLRRFRDCKDGEIVTVVDKDGELREATVHYYGAQQLQRVKLHTPNSQFEVICTPDHRWILSDGSVTENLKVGDKLWYRPDNTQHTIDNVRAAEMFCLGMAIADGCDYKNKGSIGIRVILCGDKIKYSKYFELAGYRKSMQNGYIGYSKLHISKQKFLDGECWKYLSAYDNRYLFMGYYAGDGEFDGNSCVTVDTRVLDFIRYTCNLCGYFITSEKFCERRSGYANGKPYYRIQFTTHTNKYNGWVVESIEHFGVAGTYCVEEPITHSFTLEKGIPTGNCSARFEFRRGKFFDDKYKELSRAAENPIGNYVMVSMTKNKTCPPTRRTGFYTLRYDIGIDYIYDLTEVAIKYGIIDKAGAWFSILDTETGEVIAKLQGQSGLANYLDNEDNISTLKMIEDYLDKKMSED